MTSAPPITFVTVCKARLAHLQQSLPAAAAQAPCVVVDYACPERTADWVSAHHPDVALVRIDESIPFSVAAGRNAGAAVAKTEWLCFLDADVVLTAHFVEALSLLLRSGYFYRASPLTEDNWGTVICARADFERLGGYDVVFDTWGGEDDDLFQRLQLGGVKPAQFPAHLITTIQHDDATRMRFYGEESREISRRLNVAYIQLKNDLRVMLGSEPGLPLRRAMYSEVTRVLSGALHARSQARLSVDLPDGRLLPGWHASRTLVYTFPPSDLAPPVIHPRAPAQLRDATGRLPMPFIVGTGRCGSTLLRLMLDSHPELAIPNEAIFMPDLVFGAANGAGVDELLRIVTSHHSWKSYGLDLGQFQEAARSTSGSPFAAVLRAFYDCYAKRFLKGRCGDKTIVNTKHIAFLAAQIPEARFIHLIRDGRDVAVSMRGLWFGMDELANAASYWSTTILNVRATVDSSRCLEIRYEDLVAKPEETLRRICDFISLDWNASMLNYPSRAPERLAEGPDGIAWDGTRMSAEAMNVAHELTNQPPTQARVGAWKTTLDAQEVRQFELIAGPLLTVLGYEVGR